MSLISQSLTVIAWSWWPVSLCLCDFIYPPVFCCNVVLVVVWMSEVEISNSLVFWLSVCEEGMRAFPGLSSDHHLRDCSRIMWFIHWALYLYTQNLLLCRTLRSVLELQELFSLSCHLQYPLHHLYHHSYNHWQDFHLISRLVSFSIWYVIWTAPSANLGVQDIKFMWWWFWGFWLGWNMEFCLELGFFWRFSFTINGRQIKIFYCSCTNWEVYLPTP